MGADIAVLDIRPQVHTCLRYLADHDTGFRRIDSDFGRELATTECLSTAQVVVATKLLNRYRQQLETQGMVVPDEESIANWAVEQHDIVSDEEIAALLSDLPLLPEPSASTAANAQDEVPNDSAEKSEQSGPVMPDSRVFIERNRLFIMFQFDRLKVGAMQPLKDIDDWAFNRYKRNEWSFPLDSVSTVFEALQAFHDFFYSPEVIGLIVHARRKEALECQVSELEERWHTLSQLAALEAVQPFLNGAPTANGQRLFRHQREAVQRLIEAQRFILAHDLGLGKTKSSLIAAQAYDLPIWVIAPAVTLINWQREAAAAGVSINLFSWAKLPEPPEDTDYVLIADEAHYAQAGENSQRGRGFLQLADKARAVFMLSGTPIRNSLPINLYPLLVAARHPLAADKSAYENYYCGAYMRKVGRKRYALDVSGASNLDDLHEKTRDVILYKKKQECIDLPDKLRVLRLAEVSETGEIAYRKTIERLRQEHLERMADKYEALRAGREDLLGEGVDESDLEVFESEDAHALVELGIFRHASSLAKVESAVELAQEALEQGQGVLLFVAFRDSAERLATKLTADCLTGEVTGKKRQAMIDRFQAGESRVLVATLGAGGIGINLTAAQVVIMLDRGWTPTDVEQAEGRAHRLGQRHNVTSLWLQYGAIDEKIDQLLQVKQERIETILRGRCKNLRGIPSIRSLAREIIESANTGKSLAEILGLDPAEFEQQAVDLVRDDAVTIELQPGAKKDGRLKGRTRRVRKNIMLDEDVVRFLESMKATNQTAAKEGGYSGFLERLVRESPEYQTYYHNKK